MLSKKPSTSTGSIGLFPMALGLALIAAILFFGLNALFNSFAPVNPNPSSTVASNPQSTAVNRNQENVTPEANSSIKDALLVAADLATKRIPVTASCGTLSVVSGKLGWVEFANEKFGYSIQYPEKDFSKQELNDCALVELTPSKDKQSTGTASVNKYYIGITAIKTRAKLGTKAWSAAQLNDLYSYPDVARNLKERQFAIGNLEVQEVGPIPGQIDDNFLTVSSPNLLLQIVMYPAPTEPGGTRLPSVGKWDPAQEEFPSLFYQILSTLRIK